MTSRGKALHVNKGLPLIANDNLPMSFVPKDQDVNLWVGSWAVSLASLSAPIAHARLNRASLTCCTQLDTCLVACIQLDTIISNPAVFQCPTFHAPLLIWLDIFFLQGQYSLTVSFETISTHNALDLIFWYMHTPHNTDWQYDQHFERAPRKPLWVLRISALLFQSHELSRLSARWSVKTVNFCKNRDHH